MNIYRFDSDRNDDNKYTRAMYFDMTFPDFSRHFFTL